MSRGFVKEYEDQWLHEISPTMGALIQYLTRENNDIPIYEKATSSTPEGKKVHTMSNGISYAVNDQNEWYIVEELLENL